VIKNILKGFLYFILLFIFIELLFYFSVPVYDFPPSQPFSGNEIYNPYQGIDITHWKKTNFHFHLKAWGGLTSGRGNTGDLFWNTYKKLGYTMSSVSDYQKINTFNKDSVFYIPAYEHGFGLRKKHQILIGAKEVLWLDYSLFQTLNHKQHILNLLRRHNEIVAIAHPDWEHGYSATDLKYLSNYDLIEALDANWRSVPLWDAVLSSGHPVFILSDDDAHDIKDPYQIGRCCTFINSSTMQSDDIIRSLKGGKAFGAEIYMSEGENFEVKAQRAKEVPVLNSVDVRNDTLFVRVSKVAMEFNFIGQDGKSRKKSKFSSEAWYRITPEDTYIRTEIRFFNQYNGPGTIFYLNPVFKYNGKIPSNSLKAEINWPRTWIFRLFSIPPLILLVFLWGYKKNKKRKRNLAANDL
jgi:hypothetical protein